MKYEIKCISGTVLYTAELPDGTPSGLACRVALEKAVSDGARLEGAWLEGAWLEGAWLEGAWLQGAWLEGAMLQGAWLEGAWLEGARLQGAWLEGAMLQGAWLQGARLEGAWLRGARLEGAWLQGDCKLIGQRPILAIGPIGSRCDYLTAYLTDKGAMIRTGCFFGTVAEFEEACAKTHGDNQHAREYKAALSLIAAHADIWSAEVTE